MSDLLFSDFKAWNDDWERSLAKGLFRELPFNQMMVPDSARQRTLNLLLAVTREVCQLQVDMAAFSPEQNWSQLEEKWESCTRERREELALEGLCRAARVAPARANERGWCPELTVSALAASGRSGDGFLSLFRRLMADSSKSEIKVPKMIQNAMLDRHLKHVQVDDLIRSSIHTTRSYFMSMTAWQISLALFDTSESYILSAGPSDQSDKKALRNIRKTIDDVVDVCHTCGLDEAHLKNKTLKGCVGCKAIGRTMRYCSRECQSKDWKHGVPVPHKRICGKLLDDLPQVLDEEQRLVKDIVPDAKPGFERSPELQRQISFQSLKPRCDYILVLPAPHNDYGFNVPDANMEFLVMRRRAWYDGNVAAVRCIYRMLAQVLNDGLLLLLLQEQFMLEYGVDVDGPIGNLAPITDDEKQIALRIIASAR